MKRLLLIATVLLLASCGEDIKYGNEKLQTGTYATSVKAGTICVDILDKKNCKTYLLGHEHCGFDGTYDINGSDIHIKGYAQSSKMGYDTYTFTGSVGGVTSETSFEYFVETPDGKNLLTFNKR